MKSQTKIIIAALVAAVVAFSAVGATYAWFSDTEKTDVSVSTGTVDVSYVASDLKMYSYDSTATATDCYKEVSSAGKFTCGGTADLTPFDDSAKVTISNMAPGDKITFTLTAYNESSLNIQYRTLLSVTGEKGDLTITGATEGASDWTTVAGVTAKAQLGDAMEITIAIPIESVKAVNCEIVFTLEAVQSNADPYTYISTVDQLYAFANDVNIAGNTYSGKTIKLCADLDLGGAEWVPISTSSAVDYFRGSFDGQNHTISNFKVTEPVERSGNTYAGFFGCIAGSVKDLKITDAEIYSTHYAGAIVGMSYTNISGCEVSDSVIISSPELVGNSMDNGDKVGGIVGFCEDGTVSDCKVSNTTLSAYRDVGGIAGTCQKSGNGTATVSNCTVDNVTINQNFIVNYKDLDPTNPMGDNGSSKYLTYGDYCSQRCSVTFQDCTGTITHNVVYDIYTVDQLYCFAETVNAGTNFKGLTVSLCADLDLGGAEWTPISGKENDLVYVGFQGIFDGNSKTVSNFKVTKVNHCAGFFGEIYNKNAVVKDLTIDNATITSNHFSGGIVGHMGSGTISGCNVTNSNISAAIEEVSEGTWDNGDKVGGIAGFAQGTIENCAVSSTKITAYRDIGGIAGASGTPSSSASTVALLTVKGCTVTDVTICQNLAHDGKGIDTNGVTDSGNGYYTWDSVCSARNIWNNGTDTTYTHSAEGVTFSQC